MTSSSLTDRIVDAFVAFWLWVFKSLTPQKAARLGGAILGFIGPKTKRHRVVLRNLALCLPERQAEHERIAKQSWENLGMVLGEYAHLRHFTIKEHIDVKGFEYFEAALNNPKGAIFFGAHMGNWEIAPKLAKLYNREMALVYRTPNNKLVAERLEKMRGNVSSLLLPKGRTAARGLLKHLSKGGIAGVLIDQKMNDGMAVPFFGRTAMTAGAMTELAFKTGCLLIPSQTQRRGPAAFSVTFHPPLTIPDAKDEAAALTLMTEVNAYVENWVREKPEDWLWLHRRFDKALYK